MEIAWDDGPGVALDPTAAEAARAEEITYVRKMNLYTDVPVEECLRKIGRQPIGIRWIDISNGDVNDPKYRSILVAREVDIHKMDDLFAATTRHEALKIILSMAACCNTGEVTMINDISRAIFHAKA